LNYSCPVNSQPNVTAKGVDCICKVGFYKSNDTCKLIPDCPLNAVFNVNDRKCVCNIDGQFMVNGACISCGKN
jgi:5-methylthioribose kinase